MVRSINMRPYSIQIYTVRKTISIVCVDPDGTYNEVSFDFRQIPELINTLREAEDMLKAEE